MSKPTHAKPSLYAHIFYDLKEIAKQFGYNLVLHGSLARDLDLIAIPWQETLGDAPTMIQEFANHLGGSVVFEAGEDRLRFQKKYHGRTSYIINLNRECKMINDEWIDPQYYLDISVLPHENKIPDTLLETNQKDSECIGQRIGKYFVSFSYTGCKVEVVANTIPELLYEVNKRMKNPSIENVEIKVL
jgi:hypothetical protein